MEIKLENWFSTKIFHTNIDIEFCNKLQEKVVIDKDNWKRVNKIKEREWWRSFAPSVLEEEADKWFAKMPFPSPYMLFTGQVINSEKIPAITHVDNSSRIQTVNKSSGQYYQMIKDLIHFLSLHH